MRLNFVTVAFLSRSHVITLISEILPIPGLELAGPLPEEFQSYVSFAAGLGSKAANAEAGGALIRLLGGPDVNATFVGKGIERR
jgi:molybdate transport system substrate-binding protein